MRNSELMNDYIDLLVYHRWYTSVRQWIVLKTGWQIRVVWWWWKVSVWCSCWDFQWFFFTADLFESQKFWIRFWCSLKFASFFFLHRHKNTNLWPLSWCTWKILDDFFHDNFFNWNIDDFLDDLFNWTVDNFGYDLFNWVWLWHWSVDNFFNNLFDDFLDWVGLDKWKKK